MKPYLGGKPYIFVSYSHKDTEKVLPLIEKMQIRGYRIWYDAAIAPITEFYDVIADKISCARCFVAFITENYSNSDFCYKEIKYAVGEKMSILPVFLEETTLKKGMALAVSDTQCVLKYECKDEKQFFNTVYSSCQLDACLEEDPKKILSEIEDALIINNCVPAEKILTARLTDKVFPVLKTAYDKSFSHIPIVDNNGVCIGIFGHSMWSEILLDKLRGGQACLDGDITFNDLKQYIAFESQKFEDYVFLSRESTMFNVKLKTSQAYNKRFHGVGMFFVTETGAMDEPLLGILTPTGILGRKILD